MSEISVLIPTYNCEKYIGACLESVVAQTVKDIEIIVINDGSTDNTLSIVNTFAKNDDRIKVFNQINMGLSATRNRLIEESTSPWITFVDSDDWIDNDYIEYLCSLRDKTHQRVIAANHWVETNRKKILRFPKEKKDRIISKEDAWYSILYHGIPDVSVWGKLYKREVLENINYPTGKMFEDTARIAEIINRADAVAFGIQAKYHYRYLDNSISKEIKADHLFDFTDAVEHMLSQMNLSSHRMKKGAARRRTHAALSTMRLKICGTAPDWTPFISCIRSNALAVILDSKTPLRDKLGVLAAIPGKTSFDIFWSIFLKMR